MIDIEHIIKHVLKQIEQQIIMHDDGMRIDTQGHIDDAIMYYVQGDRHDSRTMCVRIDVDIDHPLHVGDSYIDDALCACAHGIVFHMGIECFDDDAIKTIIECTFIPAGESSPVNMFQIVARIVETF